MFGYFHKWEVLGIFGNQAKHMLVGLLGLLHLLLALVGLSLLRKPSKRSSC